MEARRRAGPAAIAATLLGVGLLLYRPRIVPELRAGSRAAALLTSIPWLPAPEPSSADAERDGYSRTARPRAEDAEDKDADWRDALSDRGFAGGHFPSASRARPTTSSRFDQAMNASSFTAELDSMHSTGSRPLKNARRRENRGSDAPRTAPPASEHRRVAVRRALLASGPAYLDDKVDEDDAPTVDGKQNPSRADTAAWTKRWTRAFPLFRPPRPAAVPAGRAKTAASRKVRPPLLSKLLGRGALRPPPASIVPPDLSNLKGRRPLVLPNGAPTPTRPYELDRIEAQDPRRLGATCRRRAPHWDAGPLWHDGPARGLISDARWLWLWKKNSRTWALSEADSTSLLRHQGLWWSKQRGVWFALHDGELWSWRRFSKWDAEGLIRLSDGIEIVYSADFTKVAVITPGAGAVLYDAATGAELGEWLESELPRRRPRPPSDLRLPRGI